MPVLRRIGRSFYRSKPQAAHTEFIRKLCDENPTIEKEGFWRAVKARVKIKEDWYGMDHAEEVELSRIHPDFWCWFPFSKVIIVGEVSLSNFVTRRRLSQYWDLADFFDAYGWVLVLLEIDRLGGSKFYGMEDFMTAMANI